jgi:hypothetical protein
MSGGARAPQLLALYTYPLINGLQGFLLAAYFYNYA